MNKIKTLIDNLESKDPLVRNKSAIELMDIGNSIAVLPLIKAICNPDNINHRGTLVYALEVFDCRDHIKLLVELALTGNFEVSSGACGIIVDIELSYDHVKEIKKLIGELNVYSLQNDHNLEAFELLLELVNERHKKGN